MGVSCQSPAGGRMIYCTCMDTASIVPNCDIVLILYHQKTSPQHGTSRIRCDSRRPRRVYILTVGMYWYCMLRITHARLDEHALLKLRGDVNFDEPLSSLQELLPERTASPTSFILGLYSHIPFLPLLCFVEPRAILELTLEENMWGENKTNHKPEQKSPQKLLNLAGAGLASHVQVRCRMQYVFLTNPVYPGGTKRVRSVLNGSIQNSTLSTTKDINFCIANGSLLSIQSSTASYT